MALYHKDVCKCGKCGGKTVAKKTQRKVIVLVDEYDKPLLSTMLTNPEQEEKKQRALQGIFLCLKRCRWGSEVRVFYWCNKVHKGIHLL